MQSWKAFTGTIRGAWRTTNQTTELVRRAGWDISELAILKRLCSTSWTFFRLSQRSLLDTTKWEKSEKTQKSGEKSRKKLSLSFSPKLIAAMPTSQAPIEGNKNNENIGARYSLQYFRLFLKGGKRARQHQLLVRHQKHLLIGRRNRGSTAHFFAKGRNDFAAYEALHLLGICL